MSASDVTELDRVRKLYPDQPLVMLEIEGDLEFYPLGQRLTFTYRDGTSIVIRGIVNADGSMVVKP